MATTKKVAMKKDYAGEMEGEDMTEDDLDFWKEVLKYYQSTKPDVILKMPEEQGDDEIIGKTPYNGPSTVVEYEMNDEDADWIKKSPANEAEKKMLENLEPKRSGSATIRKGGKGSGRS